MGAAEGNALLSSLAGSHGLERMLLIKMLVAVLIGCIVWRKEKWHLWPWLNWGMVGVAFWNMAMIGYAL